MLKIFARIQRPSLRWGLLFGIMLGIVEVVYNFAVSYVTDASVQSVLGYVMALLFIATGFYAALRASQETGKWTSGLAAGIWVAVFGTIIFYLIPLANTLLNLPAIVASEQLYLKTHPVKGLKPSDYTASDVIVTQLLVICTQMIFCALFTTVSGGFGGFVGRKRALAASASQGYEAPLVEESAPAPKVDVETEEISREEARDEEAKDEATK